MLYALSPHEFAEARIGDTLLTLGRLIGMRDDAEAKRLADDMRRSWRFRHKPRLVALVQIRDGAEVWRWPGGSQVTTSSERLRAPRMRRLGTLCLVDGHWHVRGNAELLRAQERELAAYQRRRAWRVLAGMGAGA